MGVILSDTKCCIYLRRLKVSYFVQLTLNSTAEYNVTSLIEQTEIYGFNVSWSVLLRGLLFLAHLGVLSLLWIFSYSLKLYLATCRALEGVAQNSHI